METLTEQNGGRKPMREILFRGKRIDNGEWVYGYVAIHTIIGDETELKTVIVQKPDKIYQYDSWIVDPETVGQDTGLKDKNGKKIFEGDVLHWDLHWGWYVGYENGSFRRIPLLNGQRINWKYHPLEQQELDTWEVIGNVHDNPELVEDK